MSSINSKVINPALLSAVNNPHPPFFLDNISHTFLFCRTLHVLEFGGGCLGVCVCVKKGGGVLHDKARTDS